MLELEQCRKININHSHMPAFQTTNGESPCYEISYNAGVLSEPVGSGKTIDILGLICLSRLPRVLPDISNLPYAQTINSVGYIHKYYKKILLPTIIFVGLSVLKQWENAINIFTDLRVFVLKSIFEMRTLLLMIEEGSINDYDIVLVKNGHITTNFKLPHGIQIEKKNKIGNPFIYNVIANLREYCWARVVIDDFDTIKLPNNAGIVNGLFTWYISSTRKKMMFRNIKDNISSSASEILHNYNYGCANIMYNNIMFTYINVRNDINFIRSSTDIPIIKFYSVRLVNPNNIYVSLLNDMGGEQARVITEMLNGDAFSAAADAAGIKTSSVADIFEKILGDQFKQYVFAGDLLEFISHVRTIDLMEMARHPDRENAKYGKNDLLNFVEPEYKYPGITKIIDTTDEEYRAIKKSSGNAIQRVKDNIKNGACPICRENLTDTNETAIAKCCGMVFCGVCGITGQQLKGNALNKGTCANCRASISIKDMIYIENFDLEKIENEEFEEADIEKLEFINVDGKPPTKYNTITKIIFGCKIPDIERIDLYIPNIMKGSAHCADTSIRKVLIFANFEESLKNVVKELNSAEVLYWRLSGGVRDINAATAAFTTCETTCALVINSAINCSGLNLQTATDLIFVHNIRDASIESQVIGRGHRMGRNTSLNVWYLHYENEYLSMAISHGLRKMTDEEIINEKNNKALFENIADNSDKCEL